MKYCTPLFLIDCRHHVNNCSVWHYWRMWVSGITGGCECLALLEDVSVCHHWRMWVSGITGGCECEIVGNKKKTWCVYLLTNFDLYLMWKNHFKCENENYYYMYFNSTLWFICYLNHYILISTLSSFQCQLDFKI